MSRLLISLLLSFLLATGSVTAAVMHGQMQGASVLVICSDSADGSGVATVIVDANGVPVTASHDCLDCLAAHAMALLAEPPAPEAPLALSGRLAVLALPLATGRPAPAAIARGPPPSPV